MELKKLSDVWVEKYRPSSLDDYVDGTINKEIIKKFIDCPKDMPHLLLVSRSAGTGKTTLAQIIMNSLDTDCLVLNSSMDRGIDTVRERLNIFASTNNRTLGVPKIIFLDEADSLTVDAQNSLRNLMETNFSNCRFILTGNNAHKIIDPIKSRCMQFDLCSPDKDKIKRRVIDILTMENITYNLDVVNSIIDKNYPNIRNILIYLQKIFLETGNINYDSTKFYSIEKEIYSLLKQKSFINAREKWLDNGLSAEYLLHALYQLIMEDTSIEESKKKKIFILLATYSYRMAVGADSDIQLCAFFSEFIAVL